MERVGEKQMIQIHFSYTTFKKNSSYHAGLSQGFRDIRIIYVIYEKWYRLSLVYLGCR